ncbi:hypothetical protein AKJ60_00185 [candidate division MSBL1 archaeon SCGC-AAA385M11]|nr:hypothetical protein AKJ60_00185 [candidate division MSBL1 archaeon SCGC-AAA385M11]
MEITSEHLDALQEMTNIGMGKAAGVLNEMVNAHVHLQVPEIQVFQPGELACEMQLGVEASVSAVRLKFNEPSGSAVLLFSQESAAKLVALLVGDGADSFDLDTLRVGTLQEIGNIVLSTVLGTLGDLLGEHFPFLPPEYLEENITTIVSEYDSQEHNILYIKTFFHVEQHNLEGEIIFIFQVNSFDRLLKGLDEMISSL